MPETGPSRRAKCHTISALAFNQYAIDDGADCLCQVDLEVPALVALSNHSRETEMCLGALVLPDEKDWLATKAVGVPDVGGILLVYFDWYAAR